MLTESDTRAKLIDPAIHRRGWTEDLIRCEETAGAIEIGDTGPRRRPCGRIAAVLNEKITPTERLRTDLEKQLHEIKSLPAALLKRAFNGEL